jgi:hypothetical protein
MPFRAILYRLDKSKKVCDHFLKDLFQQIDGPEWVDWLSVYLGDDGLRSPKEMDYLVQVVKGMHINNVEKIVAKTS